MRVQYDENSDVLYLRFSSSRLMRNRSKDPLIEVWFDADDRLIEVTVHAAKAYKHWPIEELLLTSSKQAAD